MSFPSNHSALASAAAFPLLLVSPPVGLHRLAAAILMAAAQGWIGAQYLHRVLGGFIVGALGALVARLATWTVRRKGSTLAARLMDGPLLTTA